MYTCTRGPIVYKKNVRLTFRISNWRWCTEKGKCTQVIMLWFQQNLRERERGLQLWKNDNATCPLCGKRQSLLHVLSNCKVAREFWCYSQWHSCRDSNIHATHSCRGSNIHTTQVPPNHLTNYDGYKFPMHIVSTDLCWDIVCWDDQR